MAKDRFVGNLVKTDWYAQARAQGYRKANGNYVKQRGGGSSGSDVIGMLFIAWIISWILPAMTVYEVAKYGVSYTYTDMTTHLTGFGLVLVILSFIGCVTQIFYIVRACIK
jgi:hypothetical protein